MLVLMQADVVRAVDLMSSIEVSAVSYGPTCPRFRVILQGPNAAAGLRIARAMRVTGAVVKKLLVSVNACMRILT